LISHTGAWVVRKYGETPQENRKEATLHRQLALEEMKDSSANSGKMASASFMEEKSN
jgi:hypothetical protein